MALESFISPEETPALAAEATAVIDARLSRFGEAERAAYWASIRKAYNTPYNTPAKAAKPVVIVEAVEIALPEIEFPVAAIAAAAIASEARAA